MNINETATRDEDYNSDLYLTEPASKSVNMDLLNNPEALMVYQFTNSIEKLEISIVRTLQESITIELFDLSGKLVGSKKFPNLQNGNKLIIDISQLPSGTYIFNFIGNDKVYSTNKFQIIK